MRNLNITKVTKGIAESTGLRNNVNGVHPLKREDSPADAGQTNVSTQLLSFASCVSPSVYSNQPINSATSMQVLGGKQLTSISSTPTYVSSHLSNALTSQTVVKNTQSLH